MEYDSQSDIVLLKFNISKVEPRLTARDQFRPGGRSNRSGRGPVEHNVLEGLPINQYRVMEVTVGMNDPEQKEIDKDARPELPMPRDSHMLPEHSQQLLRAARRGRVIQPPAPPDEERENLDDEEEHKEVERGFTVKKFVKVPRHLEESEPEYLAKRRKGLPSQYTPTTGQAPVQPTPMRETKVKKVDAEGNVAVYKVLVPEGQAVEGEVQEADPVATEVAPAVAAPGTVVEGVGVVNAEGVVVANDIPQQTPPRRRPPPPKKKARRGPGRGHKKIKVPEGGMEGGTESGTPASGANLLTVPHLKQEEGSVGPSDGDTPMADAGEEEGESDGGSEDDDREDGELSPTPVQRATPSEALVELVPEPISEPSKAPAEEPAPIQEIPMSDEPPALAGLTAPAEEPAEPTEPEAKPEKLPNRDPSSSPDLPLATAIAHSRQNSLNQIPTLPLESALEIGTIEPVPEPVSEAPPTEAPPTEAPPTEAPLTEAPLTEAPPTEAPPTEAPPTEAPPTEAPTTEAPTTETLPTETPPTEAPPTEVPPTEAPPTEASPPKAPTAQTPPKEVATTEDVHMSDGEPDILGSLEAHLEKDSRMMAGP
ncbi:uncharacterized protein BDR25DRAFT_69902 [Lindgomyces ingoldianus]|uniref:Uncharacterized protein n=1 Tax=Lindgomyces ingoldianus TaxID=673940 RepID=A0ACB6QL45_9PLEO|nr:uncharacterized protein BDR25DRAFT_69902 [Lindgomyces ingoldianus]KAF2467245.1 hypothetical protein BDR25DRAFT_69902 [Lindgomyces ingoldianus]